MEGIKRVGFPLPSPIQLSGRHCFQTLAFPVIQVDELLRFHDVTNDIEFSDGFFLGRSKGGGSVGKALGIQDVFAPNTGDGKIFQTVGVLDQYVHDLLL
jgi:hypothetical protein